jgi:DNA-binding protein HU-beta
METINKAELVEIIALGAMSSKAQAEYFLNATLEAIAYNLKKGKNIKLVGFGSFYLLDVPERYYRNPHAGGVTKVPAKRTARFKAGTRLEEILNKNFQPELEIKD